MKFIVLTIITFFTSSFVIAQNNPPRLGQDPISDVVSAMTLEEKAGLVVGTGLRIAGISNSLDKVPGEAGSTFAIPRLGIPSMVMADGPAGVRIDPVRSGSSKTYYATSFPIGTSLASTWDTSLVRSVGVAFGSEVREYGLDFILGPAMNIQRNPLGGRNFEYLSEDPVLSGNIAAAMVNGIQSNGVGASLKHFALNNSETNRMNIDAVVDGRALREIYLKGFEIAIDKSNPWTVMSSYNKINGTYASQNSDLLMNILRKEWGFKGFVMTDWLAGNDPVAQMKAENDLIMPGSSSTSQKIIDAVNNGILPADDLNRNISNILEIILKTPVFRKYNYSDQPDLANDAIISRDAATEGMVLLKNDGTALPLADEGSSIALFGISSYELIPGGTGSGSVNAAYTVSLDQGLVNENFQLNDAITSLYAHYIDSVKAVRPPLTPLQELLSPYPPIADFVPDHDFIEQQAASSEVAIISLGRKSGEGADRQLTDDFLLTDKEQTLIQEISDAFHAQDKKVVVVLNSGGVMEVASWRDKTDAILVAWQPGLEGGNAIARVLSGVVNPSGKLPVTFPVNYKDEPSASTYPGDQTAEYNEGIYVGYRYFNTNNVLPAYEFGYGLSYTTFDYDVVNLSSPQFDDHITASVTIGNSGKVTGKEVVQMYISAPGKSMDKASEELKGFGKTDLLAPGRSQTFSFVISAWDLASFDTVRNSWIAEPGVYTVKMGSSSKDIRTTGTFELDHEIDLGISEKGLPITLLNFDAVKSGDRVIVVWSTGSEQNNSGFDVERSTDAKNWMAIGHLDSKAVNGNSSELLNYQYIDEEPQEGLNYYRLRQTSLDGRSSLSMVKTVNFDDALNISLYPNPVKSTAVIRGLSGTEMLFIYDERGSVVRKEIVSGKKQPVDFSNLAAGTYRVQIFRKDGTLMKTISVVRAR